MFTRALLPSSLNHSYLLPFWDKWTYVVQTIQFSLNFSLKKSYLLIEWISLHLNRFKAENSEDLCLREVMNYLFDCTPPCSIACFVALYFCKISSAVERPKLKTNERENFCLRFLWSSKSFTLCFAERMDDLCQRAYITPHMGSLFL